MSPSRTHILPVRVAPSPSGSTELEAFRNRIREDFTGDARPRPLDCTGRRFLVRKVAMDRFAALAQQHGLGIEPEAPPAR